MAETRVTGLNFYPIKSCAGMAASEIKVTPTGFEYDHEWMLIDSEGKCMTQVENPEMALIIPDVLSSHMVINAPQQEHFSFSMTGYEADNRVKQYVDATINGESVIAQDEGPTIADWFSNFFEKEVRLVKLYEYKPRFIADRYHKSGSLNIASLTDGFPLTLASESSLEELNSRLKDSVPMNRFRPNIVIAGKELEPYSEDYWRRITIGKMTAHIVRPCARTAVVDTSQLSGQLMGDHVRTALSKNRLGIDLTIPGNKEELFFMQNLNHEFRPGLELRIGDKVVIEDQDDKPNFMSVN